MKPILLTLLTIGSLLLTAQELAIDNWKPNTPKTGTVVIENNTVLMRSDDNKLGACMYHQRTPAIPGQAYKLTVKVSGQGTLEAGLYLYGKAFLGREPSPMEIKKIDSQEPFETVFYLQAPNGVYANKEEVAFYRVCLRAAQGEIRILSAAWEPIQKATQTINHLDTSRSVKGEILPLFSEPNLLDMNSEKWQIIDGKANFSGQSLKFSQANEKSTALAISPVIKVKPGEKYLLTGLYHTSDARFGSFGQAKVIPADQIRSYQKLLNKPQLYSPFLGRELYNRKSGEWVRLSSAYTPPDNVFEVNIVIIQYGTPCNVDWSSFYFGMGPWQKDSRSTKYDWSKYVNNLDPVLSGKEAAAILNERPNVTIEVKQADYPRLFINGELAPSLVYFGDYTKPSRSKLQDFRQAGVNLQIVPMSRNQKIWRGNRDYDFGKMDRIVMDNVQRNPRGNFIVLLDCSPYDSWADEFPNEVAMNSKGKPVLSRHGEKGRPCYWSPIYRQQVIEFIKEAVSHMKKQLYFKAVGGIFIAGNEDGQFYYQVLRNGILEDGNSPGAIPEFRRWLKQRYGNLDSLRQAWNNPQVTFEKAIPPVTEKRYPGNFYNPGIQMPQIDLTRFLNESMGEFVNQMCKTAKETAGKPIISVMWWGRGGSMMVYPHFAQTAQIFPNNDLDLMGAQPGYQGERNAGSSNFFSWIPDSARIHGKISMIEADFRTWTSHINSLLHDYLVARYWNHDELRGALFRDFGRQLSVGGGLWFYDMTGGWFKDPLIMNDVAKLTEIANNFNSRTDVYKPAEIVFVADEENYYYSTEQLNVWNGPNFHTIRKNQRAMLRSGLKYDFYYFNDLVQNQMNQYKVYIFLNAFHLTPEKQNFINHNLKKDGKTIVWLYAPGYLANKGFSLDAMNKLTGMNIIRANNALKDSFYVESPLTHGLTGIRVGLDNTLGGESFKVEDSQAVPLMRYYHDRQSISGAMRDFKTWKSIYLGAPVGFTPEFLQNLARSAGIHVYNTAGDMFIHRRDDLICLHGVIGNENRIKLPYAATLKDLENGQEIKPVNGEFIIKLNPAETRLLEIIKQR